MALILSLETSTDICSVALHNDGKLLAFAESNDDFSHATNITLFIQKCLNQASKKINELDAIAISIGPGSYTGLRIGLSTAKGICYGQNIPLLAINSLDILAQGSKSEKTHSLVIAMIDARRMEAYAAIYNNALEPILKTHSMIITDDTFDLYKEENIYLIGNGYSKAIPSLNSIKYIEGPKETSAKFMGEIALYEYHQKKYKNIFTISPNYLKAPNITKSNKNIIQL